MQSTIQPSSGPAPGSLLLFPAIGAGSSSTPHSDPQPVSGETVGQSLGSANLTAQQARIEADGETMNQILTRLHGLWSSDEDAVSDDPNAEEVAFAQLWNATSGQRYIHEAESDFYEEVLERLQRGEMIPCTSMPNRGFAADSGEELGLADALDEDLGFTCIWYIAELD